MCWVRKEGSRSASSFRSRQPLCENCEHLIGEIREEGKKEAISGQILDRFSLSLHSRIRDRERYAGIARPSREREYSRATFFVRLSVSREAQDRDRAQSFWGLNFPIGREFEHTRAEIFEDKHTPRCLFSAIETNARERAERERRRRCFCLAEEPSFGAKNGRERDILEGKFSRSTIRLSGEIRRKGRSVREGRSPK